MMGTGKKMLNVPYKGGGAALNDLIAGFTHIMFPQLPAVIGALAPPPGRRRRSSPDERCVPREPRFAETRARLSNLGADVKTGWPAEFGTLRADERAMRTSVARAGRIHAD